MWKIIKIVVVFISAWLFSGNKPAKANKLKQKVDDITNEQAKILDCKPVDYRRYHKLDAELVRLNKKISRLQAK